MKWFLVTETFANPDHDKRQKYGFKGIKEFTKGTAFVQYQKGALSIIPPDGEKTFFGYTSVVEDGPTKKFFQETPVEEVPDVQRVAQEFSAVSFTLGLLLRQGKVTYQDVVDAYAAEEEGS